MQILSEYPLQSQHTFGAPVYAQQWLAIRTAEELVELIKQGDYQEVPKLILGGGSNILFTRSVEGLLLHNEIQGIETLKEEEGHIWLKVGGGVNWHELVIHCVSHDWGGMENLSLIPGTVGAAPIQNIGAYGVELKDIFVSLEAIDMQTGQTLHFDKEACEFGYRNSVFKNAWKGRVFITQVVFKLSTANHQINTSYGAIKSTLEAMGEGEFPSVQAISKAVVQIRQSKLPDPAVLGNCGSFFKNPEIPLALFEQLKNQFPEMIGYPTAPETIKVPAGWLIDQCGWKGKRVGNVGAYEKQALVLVNHGGATGQEAWALALQIQASVQKKFGLLIEPEVNIY